MAALNLPILKGFTIIMEGLLSGRVRSISDEHECNCTYQCKPCWEDGQRVGKRIFPGKFNCLSSITNANLEWLSFCNVSYCPTITGFTQSWKSPWILGEVLEKSLNSIFPWKVLKFLCKSLKSPWIFFNFECSGLESVFWCFLVVQDRIWIIAQRI